MDNSDDLRCAVTILAAAIRQQLRSGQHVTLGNHAMFDSAYRLASLVTTLPELYSVEMANREDEGGESSVAEKCAPCTPSPNPKLTPHRR